MPKDTSNSELHGHAENGYLIAVGCAVLATGFRFFLHYAVGPYAPYLPFMLGVIVAARYAGRWPAVLTTLLSAISGDYFFLEPRYSFAVRNPAAFVDLCLFVVAGVSVSLLIGQLREAMQRSVRSEERFRNLFNSMDEGFATCRMIYDGAGKAADIHWIEVNPAFGRVAGLTEEVVPGRSVRELIPDLEPEWIETWERIIRTGRSERFSQAAGSLGKLFEVFAFRTGRDEFAALFTDISEKRQVEEELRYLASIVQYSDDSIIGETRDGTIKSWNRGAELMFGYSREEMIGKPVTVLVPEDLWAETREISHRVLNDTRVLHHETVRLRKDGQRIDISLTASPVFDYDGAIIGVSRISRDITDRKKAEAQLYESEERYRALVTASADIIYRMSPDWSELRYSSGGHLIAGADAPSSSWLQEFIPPDDQPRVLAAINEALRTGEKYESEHRAIRVDGGFGWISSRAVPVRNARGEIIEWFGAASDISERKRAEQKIRELNASLERRVQARTAELMDANRELEAFAYSVSHDLRAPLRAVEGFANILLRDYPGKVVDETAADYMRRMSAASLRMSNLIEDLLNLSRLSRQEMHRQDVDLTAMAESIFCEYRTREFGRQVLTDVEGGLLAYADSQLMRVVLDNLFGNAWKYTSKTRNAEIHFGAVPGSKPTVWCVRDNGVGFDMKHADQLFIPFQRLHRSDEFEGNGIGLANVQRIIRRHGGRVWAEAKPNLGAAFYFTLGENECQKTKRSC